MKPRELRDRWREAQSAARRVIELAQDLQPAAALFRHALSRERAWPSSAEVAGLEWPPERVDPARFNALRLELLRRLLADSWPEAVIVEICHAKPAGIRQLARQLAGEPDPATLETLPGT